MTERISIDSDEGLALWSDPEAFLRRRGIVSANNGFTVEQLGQELTRRGWRWHVASGRVEATKAFAPAGMASQTFSASDSDDVAALTSVLVDAIHYDERHGLGFARPVQADVVVRAPNQKALAIVDARAMRGLSASVASELREKLMSRASGYALAPFLILVSPDSGYLWDQRSGLPPPAPPTRVFPMAPVIARYLPWLEPGERPGDGELVQAVAQWLDDLANPLPLRPAPAKETLEGTGFLDTIQGASVLTDAAA